VATVRFDRHTRRYRTISAELPGRWHARGGVSEATDMSVSERRPQKDEGTDGRRIAGPIPEYNRFDEYTGTTYFRCRNCGAESLRRVDLYGCCDT